jgi:Mg-chelatase subunit ChlD
VKCPSCGNENREGAAFCGGCGARLVAKCASCGADLDAGSKFCTSCGTPVAAAAAPAAPTPPAPPISGPAAVDDTKATVTIGSSAAAAGPAEVDDTKATVIRTSAPPSKPTTPTPPVPPPPTKPAEEPAGTPRAASALRIGGDLAYTVKELVELCWRHWDEAKKQFGAGNFEPWLASMGLSDLARQCESLRKGSREDLTTGMEDFLRATKVSVGRDIVAALPPREQARRLGIKADIVFCLDTTGSMSAMIEGLKATAVKFASEVAEAVIDYRLGLIGFGDLFIKEEMSIYPLTDDVLVFQKRVKDIPRTGGGDIPESALEAVKEALDFRFRPKAQKIIILITDAPPHDPDSQGSTGADVLRQLLGKEALCFVIGPRIPLYARFAEETMAAFFQISSDADYLPILGRLAGAVTASMLGRLK